MIYENEKLCKASTSTIRNHRLPPAITLCRTRNSKTLHRFLNFCKGIIQPAGMFDVSLMLWIDYFNTQYLEQTLHIFNSQLYSILFNSDDIYWQWNHCRVSICNLSPKQLAHCSGPDWSVSRRLRCLWEFKNRPTRYLALVQIFNALWSVYNIFK